jgi:hypothetical protein
MFVLSFVFIPVFKAPARALARRLLGYRTSIDRFDSSPTDSFMVGQTVDDLFASVWERREQTHKRLMAIARDLHAGHVLARLRVEPAELFELHNYLEHANLHDIAFEIISSPSELEELIGFYRHGSR